MTPDEMRERTMQFALRVTKLVRSLPHDGMCRDVSRQLLRAGTSVAANYRAACRARSRAEFVAKMGIVEEQADESVFWMEILTRSQIVTEKSLLPLMTEAGELTAIAASSKKTARSRAGK